MNLTPAAKSGRFFCCPGSAAYGILEAEIRVVEKHRFTTFGGLDLPHFAAFCRVMNFILGSAGQN
jgi:hypothetical protein